MLIARANANVSRLTKITETNRDNKQENVFGKTKSSTQHSATCT